MSTHQEYWDACLIKTWRNFGNFLDLNSMFHSITGKWPSEIEPRLLRTPVRWVPAKMGIRYYAAHFLPKINDRLLAQDPSKDVALLRKLQESTYDSAKDYVLSADERERHNMGKKIRLEKAIVSHNTHAVANRNQHTDWNKTKGGRIGRAR